MYERSLAGFVKTLGLEHSSTLQTLNNLGVLYASHGRLSDAERMYVCALAGKEKELGTAHSTPPPSRRSPTSAFSMLVKDVFRMQRECTSVLWLDLSFQPVSWPVYTVCSGLHISRFHFPWYSQSLCALTLLSVVRSPSLPKSLRSLQPFGLCPSWRSCIWSIRFLRIATYEVSIGLHPRFRNSFLPWALENPGSRHLEQSSYLYGSGRCRLLNGTISNNKPQFSLHFCPSLLQEVMSSIPLQDLSYSILARGNYPNEGCYVWR